MKAKQVYFPLAVKGLNEPLCQVLIQLLFGIFQLG